MKKKFIYLCLIVTIVLLGCFGKEKETEEVVKTNERKSNHNSRKSWD